MTTILIIFAVLAVIGFLSEKSASKPSGQEQAKDSIPVALETLEKELKEKVGDIPAQVAKRKEACRSLGVDSLALHIYDEIKHYSSWIKNGPDYVCPEVRNPKSKNTGGSTWESFTFDLKRGSYAMEFKQHGFSLPDGEYADHAELKVFDVKDGVEKLVLLVNASKREPYAEFEKYAPFDVEAFIPGDWINEFAELKDQLKLHDEQRKLKEKYDPEKLEEQKRNFGL
jgi:hypothetical protein